MNATGLEQTRQFLAGVRQEIGKVILGQQEVIDQALVVVFSGTHALVEGVPGIAKTLLVRTIATVLGSSFNRIQFTPDLMPADITGTNVFNLQQNKFFLVKGPVFTGFLLADEINRAPAKTQSALLQAMQERMVTIDGRTYPLPDDFTVFATQNPIEYEGTYPLPEAQKDRFMLKIRMDYPALEDELALASSMLGTSSPEERLAQGDVRQLSAGEALASVRAALRSVLVSEDLVKYVVEVVRRTRSHDSVLIGAGPRATQALLLASRTYAALDGRDYTTPDDVRTMAVPALEHRIVLRPEYEIEGMTAHEAVEDVVQTVEVPR